MKKVVLFFALIVGLLASATTQAQTVNMSRYITLTVTNGAAIKLNFNVATNGTPVRIVSGSNTQDITVNTNWYGTASYTADGTTMTVYGDITEFMCQENRANLTAIDLSHNTQLNRLDCYNNNLTTLDVSGCTQLNSLSCFDNNLTTLDVSHNTQLKNLYCGDNNLTSLDLSHNTQLNTLYCNDNNLTALDLSHNTQLSRLDCSYNNLTTLDVSGCTQLNSLSCNNSNLTALDLSHNTQLTSLYCSNNNLTALDLSHNTQLNILECHSNNFSTAALDDIYCSLPDKTGIINGVIYPLENSSDPNHATVLATNKQNAIAKNWNVVYPDSFIDIPATTGTYTCPQLNMDSYITLTVAKDSAIKLDLRAAARGTPVRIVSGSNTQDITVGPVWYNGNSPSTYTVTAGASTMTVYGDIIGFDCSSNGANLTALDVSQNTQLTKLVCSNNRLTSLDVSKNTELEGLNCANNKLNSLDVSKNTKLTGLYCYDNKFTTATLDDIFCALPDRTGKSYGRIQPVHNSSSSNHATVLATNKTNATAKNWKVQYYKDDTDIPATTGTYTCPQLNMSSYITLTVAKDSAIRLDFKAAAAGTPVRIVSGSNTQDITVGTTWYDGHSPSSFTVTAGSTTITIYGDIRWFGCSENGANLTAIDVSKNTQLRLLGCSSNQLSSLDLSKNTELFLLSCNDNKLTSLDISKESKLKELYCYDNNFTTATLDDIYCSLPDRTGTTFVKIQPVYNSSSSNLATVLATNAANATAKNWKVQYYKNNSDITTTGSYDCSSSAAATAAEQALTLYPNPVADVLYLSATARTIRIYDMYGTEVAHATDTDRVEVSHLPAGIYTVRADGSIAKMIKR